MTKKLYKKDGRGGVWITSGLCNVMLLKFHLDWTFSGGSWDTQLG
jgi:hypothetical protein